MRIFVLTLLALASFSSERQRLKKVNSALRKAVKSLEEVSVSGSLGYNARCNFNYQCMRGKCTNNRCNAEEEIAVGGPCVDSCQHKCGKQSGSTKCGVYAMGSNNRCVCHDGSEPLSAKCWPKSNDGSDLADKEWTGFNHHSLNDCIVAAAKAGVDYFAWNGQLYGGYCKVLKAGITPNLGTDQGYNYNLYKNVCSAAELKVGDEEAKVGTFCNVDADCDPNQKCISYWNYNRCGSKAAKGKESEVGAIGEWEPKYGGECEGDEIKKVELGTCRVEMKSMGPFKVPTCECLKETAVGRADGTGRWLSNAVYTGKGAVYCGTKYCAAFDLGKCDDARDALNVDKDPTDLSGCPSGWERITDNYWGTACGKRNMWGTSQSLRLCKPLGSDGPQTACKAHCDNTSASCGCCSQYCSGHDYDKCHFARCGGRGL